MKYKKLSNKASKFLAMTGYTVEEFEALLPYFEAEFESYIKDYTFEGKKRLKRTYTSYKNSPLPTIEDKLLFILVYLKLSHLQETQASLFEIHQSDANKWIHLLHPILNRALAKTGEKPAREAQSVEQKISQNLSKPGEETLEDKVFFQDGTERPIVRPTDDDLQKMYYSGKKRFHSLKNIILINAFCKIVLLTITCEGKKHDKKMADEADYDLPDGSILYQDTGFQGFTLPDVTIIQPKKKPRGSELSTQEKENNAAISKIRIRVEHAICGVKRYRIIKDKLRNWKVGFRDMVMETCCALHNFRLNFRPWHYAPIQL